MWSMSTSAGLDQVGPSYGLYQDPEVGQQELSTFTPEPSRRSTVFLVLHEPLIVIQCGKRSRS